MKRSGKLKNTTGVISRTKEMVPGGIDAKTHRTAGGAADEDIAGAITINPK